jgi:hypothetical protein
MSENQAVHPASGQSQRSATLEQLQAWLVRLGSANDAEDHGYGEEAGRMRSEACQAIQALLLDQPFQGERLPGLQAELDSGHILGFGWATLLDELARQRPG